MLLRRFKQLIVPSVSAVLLVAAGCHSCQFGRGSLCQNGQECQAEQQAACQEDLACKKPKNGYVNEDEKNPLVARRNAKKDAKLNADGCTPDEERIPLLKRIADKSNRESDIEVIKVAAKIKHEEEMCQQKVKAVKYLGTNRLLLLRQGWSSREGSARSTQRLPPSGSIGSRPSHRRMCLRPGLCSLVLQRRNR